MSNNLVKFIFLLSVFLFICASRPILTFAHFQNDLFYGMHFSKSVIVLQNILKYNESFYTGRIDGIYLSKTKKAVEEFQKKYNIFPVTGEVSVATKEKLNALYYPETVSSGGATVISSPFITEITSGVENNSTIETDKVIFKFKGTDYVYPSSQLTFETFLEGVDKDWNRTSSDSRTIYLPAGDKNYVFKVRAVRKNGEKDKNPPQVSFRAALSPYYKKIRIGSMNRSTSDFNQEYITINNYNYGQAVVNVTGWEISSLKEKVLIPQAVKHLTFDVSDVYGDINLNYGEYIKIVTGQGPFNSNFQVNKCSGYTAKQYNFTVGLSSSSCPWPILEDLAEFSSNCRTFFLKQQQCVEPNVDDLSIVYDNQCRDYLRENLNYKSCVNKYQKDSDFYKSEWRVYLNTTRKLWDKSHDTIRLRDKDGLIVDQLVY